jgi:hypothetical protein
MHPFMAVFIFNFLLWHIFMTHTIEPFYTWPTDKKE